MQRFLRARTEDYMSRDVVAIRPETPLADVEELLASRDFNAVPVVDDGRLAGVVSKFDLLNVFTATGQAFFPRVAHFARLSARHVMSRDVITFPMDAPLTRVLQTMVDFRLRSFPVVDGGRVVGMITREDVVRALREARAAAP